MTAIRAIVRIGRCTRRPASVSYARILFDEKQKRLLAALFLCPKQLMDGKKSSFGRHPILIVSMGFTE
jgi:hypothetical protein